MCASSTTSAFPEQPGDWLPVKVSSVTMQFPLAEGQQAIWLASQLSPHSGVYHIVLVARIKAPLDAAALRRAFQRIVDRHAILRTTYPSVDGQPVQLVHASLPIDFTLENVLDADEVEIDRRVERFWQQPFDLAQQSVVRVGVFKRAPEQFVAVLVVHHVAADGWSQRLILDELRACYAAEVLGIEPDLKPVTHHYTDFVAWQRALLNGADGQRTWEYWRGQLREPLTPITLPLDRPRLAGQTYHFQVRSLTLDADLTTRLKELARAHATTLFTVLLAALQTLLQRYTGQDDILIATPTAARGRPEFRRTIGYFVNPVIVRADLTGDLTFAAVLAKTHATVQQALAHRDYPFVRLLKQLQIERVSLVPVLFNYQRFERYRQLADFITPVLDRPRAGYESPVEPSTPPMVDNQFDRNVDVYEKDASLDCTIGYNASLFDAATIDRLLQHFQVLLTGVIANPDRPIWALPLLTLAERQQLLVNWNSAIRPLDHNTVTQWFEAQVARTPNAIAVQDERSRLTYAELNQRANQLAHHLIGRGVQPNTLIGVALQRSADLMVALLGTLKAGAAYVPIDPQYPAERQAFMLLDSKADLVLTQADVAVRLNGTDHERLCMDEDWPIIAAAPSTNPQIDLRGDHLAYVIYTSGSTGQPKGVLITHRNLVHSTQARREFYAGDLRGLVLVSPVAFDSSVAGIFWTLCEGGTLYLPAPGVERDPAALAQLIARYHPSHWLSLPGLYSAVLSVTPAPPLDSLETVIVAGETCPPGLIEQHGTHLPHAVLFNEYGPTEASVWCSVYRCEQHPLPQPVPIGRAIPGVQLYVLDAHQQLAPIGVSGELYIGGQGVGQGYLNRPDLTAEKFIDTPFTNDRQSTWDAGQPAAVGHRLYRTGDLVRYRADGNLEFLGRVDHQVKVRGYRIELGEIEAALSRHTAVCAAAVTAWPSATGSQLAAYIVPKEWPAPSARELRAFLINQLPDFMLPATFTSLDVLPLLPNGKVDRRTLPQPLATRAIASGFVPPRTALEALMAEIWTEVLGVDVVGAHDHFFELGGDSISAMQTIARARVLFRVELPIQAIFSTPTLAELAAQIDRLLQINPLFTPPPILPAPRDRSLPLSFSQERMWFVHQLDPHSAAYNVVDAMRLRGDLSIPDLQRSLDVLALRHESLRTTFPVRDGQPVQVIAAAGSIPIEVIDLQDLLAETRAPRLQQLLTAEAARQFDIESGPLMRVKVYRLGPDEHVLFMSMHHLITDAWSMMVLAQDMMLLYNAARAGRSLELPPLSVHYADYAYWQRQWLRGEVLAAHLDYWRTQLAGVQPLDLPLDHARPAVQTYRGSFVSADLDDDLLEGLRRLGTAEGATPFMVGLAAFQVLLHRYTSQTDIAVAVPIANREWLQSEQLIGSLVNTLIMRGDLSGQPTFRNLLGRVRHVALDAYAHQNMPFAKLVAELNPSRNMTQSPVAQVMFNVINVPMPDVRLGDLAMDYIEVDRLAAQFDLTVTVITLAEARRITLEYNIDLFERATADQLLGHYMRLLRAVVANPDQTIGALPLLSEGERQHLLIDWNDTVLDFERTTLHVAFERQADRTPDTVALIAGAQRLTYRELEARANQVAHHLRWLGVSAGTPVAISLPRSFELIAGLLGILKAGGVYVPIDPAAPPERLAFMLQDSQAMIWLTRQEIAARHPIQHVRKVCVDTEAEALGRQPTDRASVPLPSDPLAYIMYTSGSTGTPKGVLGRHWSALNRFNWMWQTYPFAADEVCCQKTYLSFVDSVWEIFGPLLAGVPLVLIAEEVLKDDRRLIQILDDHQVTRLVLVPSLLRVLLSTHADLPQRLPHLKYWISSGETLPLDLAQRFWQALPDATLINLYGSSEVAADSTCYEVKPDSTLRSVPIGRPIANTEVYVLDAQQQPVPIGVTGEIYIGGEGVAHGYHNRPALTAEKFIANPFEDEGQAINHRPPSIGPRRLYRTGDLGRYRADGNLEYLGRADHQVKIRGVRVELGEIEVVLKRHIQVQHAVAMVREDTPGSKQLVAYVVPRDPALTQAELRDFAKEHLADQAQPAIYMLLEALPLTPSGKIDRRALPQPECNMVSSPATPYVAPRDLTERQLAVIWEETLHVNPISVDSNFFELGGHSLLAIELFARIEDVFGQRPPLTTLFQSPTIAQLAEVLRTSGWSNQWPTLVPIQPQGTKIPFFCVHGFGGGVIDYGELARQLGSDRPFYGLQARGLDGEALPHTHIETMAAHYIEALQTVQPHGPYQIGGYCFGGVVAYEMARQLREQGEEVALVAILEGYAPVERARHRLQFIPGAWSGFVRNIPYWLRDYLALGREQVFSRSRMKIGAMLRRLNHRSGHPDAFRMEDYVPNLTRISDIHRRLIEVHLRAMQSYAPQSYAGRVTLFRVRGMSLFRADDPQMGWGRLARGGVEIKMIAGGHNTILEVPYVQSLAEQLKACLS